MQAQTFACETPYTHRVSNFACTIFFGVFFFSPKLEEEGA